MRKLIVAAFISLDGVIQAPGGPEEDPTSGFAHGGWVAPHWDEVVDAAMAGVFDGSIDLLLGRKTYDIFAAHWPRVTDDPFADSLNAMTKYVATRSPHPLEWSNSHAIGPDAARAVADLKAQNGRDLLTQGSSDLIQSLLAADLVDVLKLLTFPVVLGSGKRLFGDGAAAHELKLIDSRISPSGVIITTHHRHGPVRTGSFALDA